MISYLLYLLSLDNWVIASYLLGAQLSVVEGAAVLVTVAVH